jgi:hypothetical protein
LEQVSVQLYLSYWDSLMRPDRADDTAADVETLCKKMYAFAVHSKVYALMPRPTSRLSLRVFDNASGSMWKSSVKDLDVDVLCVSQFTLMANCSKGNKPDFHKAMYVIVTPFAHVPWSERLTVPMHPQEHRAISGVVSVIPPADGSALSPRQD